MRHAPAPVGALSFREIERVSGLWEGTAAPGRLGIPHDLTAGLSLQPPGIPALRAAPKFRSESSDSVTHGHPGNCDCGNRVVRELGNSRYFDSSRTTRWIVAGAASIMFAIWRTVFPLCRRRFARAICEAESARGRPG